MIPDHIETALRKAFLEAIPSASGNTAFENVAFDPGTRASWFAFSYIPNSPRVVTLGDAGLDEVTGFVQIDYNIASGRGKQELLAVETALRAGMSAGKRFVESGCFVTITSCGRTGGGRVVDGFYRYIFTIYFNSRIPRDLTNETIPDYVLWDDSETVEFDP